MGSGHSHHILTLTRHSVDMTPSEAFYDLDFETTTGTPALRNYRLA